MEKSIFKNFCKKHKLSLIIGTVLLVATILAVFCLFKWKKTVKTGKDANHFTAVFINDIKGLDPGNKDHTQSASTDRIFNSIHESLIFCDQTGVCIPKVAKDWKQNENDVEFTLRNDVYFHNGKKLTAQDIKFSFERAKEKQHDEYQIINNIEVLENGAKIKLSLNETPIFFWESIAKFRILSQEAMQSNEQEGLKVGAGPYKLVDWVVNDKIELELNENYYDKERIKDALKKITIKIIADPDISLLQLNEGSIDAVLDFHVDKIENAKNQKGITIVDNQAFKCTYLFMNSAKASKEKRQLIATILNIPKIIQDLDLPVKELKTYVPEGSLGHNYDIKYAYDETKLEEAKTKINALSNEDKEVSFGFSIKESVEMMKKISEKLKAAGFEVTTERPEFNTFQDNLKQGKYDISFLSDMHEMPYGHKAMLDYMMPDQTNANPTHITNDNSLKELLIEVQTQLTKEKYIEKVKKIQQIFYDQVYVIPFYQQNVYFLTNTKITNFNCDKLTRTDFTKVRKSD